MNLDILSFKNYIMINIYFTIKIIIFWKKLELNCLVEKCEGHMESTQDRGRVM